MCATASSGSAGRLKSTPTSSAEGEYAIATKATQAAIAISDTIKFMLEDLPDYKGSMSELGCTMPLFCDNKAAVLLSEGNTSSKRMRHVATQIAFLREQVKDTKRVRLIHIRTQGQVADLFTKPLTAAIFITAAPSLWQSARGACKPQGPKSAQHAALLSTGE